VSDDTSGRRDVDQARVTDLDAVARAAGREAGGVPPDLLGDYLTAAHDAATGGRRRLTARELAGYVDAGERAAYSGVALRDLVDLYLSATWRLWRELPAHRTTPAAVHAAGLAVLRAADDAVAAAAEGFERAQLSIARRDEAERHEFAEDLLSGRVDVRDLVTRGERLGLRLAGPHQVLTVGAARPLTAAEPLAQRLDRAARAASGASLVATRQGRLVIVTPAGDGMAPRIADAIARALDEASGDATGAVAPDWRVAVGRAYSGPTGVLRSYEEAESALDTTTRLRLPERVSYAADLLVYQVLLRDRAAMVDLVNTVLTPLTRTRGGAKPLLATLEAYFAAGSVTARAARALHVSVRTVTYRLARVKALTAHDPADPEAALTLHVAVIGARLLNWPDLPLHET
jgi:hypothetical protein